MFQFIRSFIVVAILVIVTNAQASTIDQTTVYDFININASQEKSKGFNSKDNAGIESSILGPLFINEIKYIVKKHDNLTRIARKFGVTVDEICRTNNFDRRKIIYPGDSFIISSIQIASKRGLVPIVNISQSFEYSSKPRVLKSKYKKPSALALRNLRVGKDEVFLSTHRVRKGENVSKIARLYPSISTRDIIGWNSLNRKASIFPGQILSLRSLSEYTVKDRDTVSAIAKNYQMTVREIKHYNPWIGIDNIIRKGQVISLNNEVPMPQVLKKVARVIGYKKSKQIARYIDIAHKETGIDREFIAVIMRVESFFNEEALSRTKNKGLMQLGVDTAKDMKVNIHDPADNVLGGARYLKMLAQKYNGDLDLILAGYNAGPDAVKKYNGVPNYPETKEYIIKVKKHYKKLKVEV